LKMIKGTMPGSFMNEIVRNVPGLHRLLPKSFFYI
jgi:hypothetical protein